MSGAIRYGRPLYSPCLTNYFLDFLDHEEIIKKIAYAASFGVENWEYSPQQTIQCAALSKKFDAISVREDTAIKLCKEHLGVKAVHVLDPTLLIPKEDYIKLVAKDNIPKSKGNLMTYVLDKTNDKNEIIQKIAKKLDLIPFSVMPEKTFSEVGSNGLKDCIFPPVTQWIRGFMDAEFVVTDSFHGTIFAIIFNKPFIVIGNSERGMTRFKSLLKIFGLKDRLIISSVDLTLEKINSTIDFNRVNITLKKRELRQLIFFTKRYKC